MADLHLRLRTQRASRAEDGLATWEATTAREIWAAERTALVLCDVWDKHPCHGAVVRLERMLPRMNEVVAELRRRGVLIAHAPSETMQFYEGTAARERARRAAACAIPEPREHDDPPLPVDSSDGGCDTVPYDPKGTWTRQHPAIEIDQERDVISDRGDELYRVYHERGIDRMLIMGVHTNMCVLNRTFAIKAMVRRGLRVALIRDLTDAMYNPLRPPYVSHDEGTRLVVEFIEKFWCPTVSSRDLLAARAEL